MLVEVLDGLLTVNGIRLDEPASEAGGGSTGAWDDVLRATADAAAMLARYSEVARGPSVPDGERLADLALRGQQAITRLVGIIVIELGVPVDRAKVVDEASQLLDEVDQEDDGVWHAQDAIGSLLQARLICAEEQIEMPPAELTRASVAILAPLLARRHAYAGHSSCSAPPTTTAADNHRRLLARFADALEPTIGQLVEMARKVRADAGRTQIQRSTTHIWSIAQEPARPVLGVQA